MSTTRDIVSAISELLTSLDALLKTDTVDAVVSLARRLGVGPMVKTGIETLQGLFTQLVAFLDKVKVAFKSAVQVPQLMEPLDSILEMLEPMAQGVTEMVGRIQHTATIVIANLPQPEDLALIQGRFTELRATLGSYREKLLEAPPPAAVPALPAGGSR
ncbi:hypothetical protein [Vitiosangium sp. GDMCC 1.1324]|uniref:hypothetical protein n=1 Tax=Vitiosangium sp. (strain GDMCC 1.1324) TaxID=2138576 RepID=UPI000D3BE2B9|nr:hypothetical protein [Vitiosangium sp. GDMCC 1.1324]PTL80162.1 hypothetical protein DAT35_29565 [Vitiosangium sp. GDMCC 1.1324]